MTRAIIHEEGELVHRLQKGVDSAKEYYLRDLRNLTEWSRYGRLFVF